MTVANLSAMTVEASVKTPYRQDDECRDIPITTVFEVVNSLVSSSEDKMGQNMWSDADAQKCIEQYLQDGEELALRVYTSRLLGSQESLVLHGGGNTSVKLCVNDSLGRPVEVVAVKGYGC